MTNVPNKVQKKLASRRRLLRWGGSACVLLLPAFTGGCKSLPPGGTPVQPSPLGSIVDEANRMQEQNAEAAKFIVYVHEFELNKPRKKMRNPWSPENAIPRPELDVESTEPRGFRLNEYGMEHVSRLAKVLLQTIDQQTDRTDMQQVVVERSESSKQWDTLHHYPVHLNDRLDEERRKVVVAALAVHGVEFADDLVIVATAYPEGLDAQEATQAYYQTFGSQNSGFGGGGGGF